MSTPRTIPEALQARTSSPRGLAFLGEEGETQRWTYGELAEVARRAAGAWRDIGVRPGDRVGLLGSTTPDLVAAIFGCWAAGAIAVPLAVPLRLTSTDALAEEVRARAEKAQLTVLAVDDGVRPLVPVEDAAPQIVDLSEVRTRGRDVPFTQVDPNDAALIQFTSGSTAFPKGVALSHRTLISNGEAAQHHVH